MNWQWQLIDSISSLGKDAMALLAPPKEAPPKEATQKEANQKESSPKEEQFNKISRRTPFFSYEFLYALEKENCVGANSGWQPQHILLLENKQVVGFIPGYIKQHSYGEYVFDHSWAHAYQQNGLNYYPKWINALPFTPVSSSKVLFHKDLYDNNKHDLLSTLSQFWQQHKTDIMQKMGVSSLHFLFTEYAYSKHLCGVGFSQRHSVQFNWHNKNYKNFDDFLAGMTARRRKSIKKERKSIVEQQVNMKRLVGEQISDTDMAIFYLCYQQTYLKRSGHGGYLSQSFFKHILNTMPDRLLLVTADKNNKTIAAALFFYDENGLYGRYWGALTDVSGLHFETCYYQGIEFCIQHHIALFNPGTQGEHKILRGFAPQICFSNHKMAEPEFDRAVADFVTREQAHIAEYAQQSATLLPFKTSSTKE